MSPQLKLDMLAAIQLRAWTVADEARQLYVLLTELDWVTPQLFTACERSCIEWQRDSAAIAEIERLMRGCE